MYTLNTRIYFAAATLAVSVTLVCGKLWQGHINSDSSLCRELGPLLSANASILVPESPDFTNYSTRWQTYRSPQIDAIVVAATEQDVQHTVCLSTSEYRDY